MSELIAKMKISSSPHLKSNFTIEQAMRDVLLALTPALILALYFFKIRALSVILACIVSAVLTEFLWQKLTKQVITISDGSAVLTGLLLAFCLPPGLPWWIAAIGSFAAIFIGKQVFGGLGNNIFNPALIGRAILLASWPVYMTTWIRPLDGVTTATPLAIVKEVAKLKALGDLKGAMLLNQGLPDLWHLFTGNVGGSIGETSAIALLVGGLYLIYKRHIDWKIPASYIGTVFILTLGIGLVNGAGLEYALFHILSGGLFLGAFFMATDWVSSPITKKGRIIFGIGCGILTVIIRLKGGYPEGVCYSILLMNCVTPLLDKYTKARVFGR
jgi:electron transport complex protein RnfD